jgi:2-dehydro-3-deoxygluconokinase
MLTFKNTKAVAIGEAMIEMAPIGEGQYRRGFAGDTFNTVWHMAQALGSEADVGFVTRVGQDRVSDAFISELAQDGMDVSKIRRDSDRTMGLYMIELDGVERSFSYWRSASAARLLASDKSSIETALLGAGLIHLSGITLAILDQDARSNLIGALEIARANGSIVSFDPNIRPQLWTSFDEIRETISRFLKVTDIGLPSFDDETGHWGDADPTATIERFAAAGVREVVVKNGNAPVQLFSDGVKSECKTPSVSGICDTTGAGDAFNAGYLAARLLKHPATSAVRAGQVMAGEVLQHFGARIPRSFIPKIGLDKAYIHCQDT